MNIKAKVTESVERGYFAAEEIEAMAEEEGRGLLSLTVNVCGRDVPAHINGLGNLTCTNCRRQFKDTDVAGCQLCKME